MMKSDWQIRGSTIFGLTALLTLLGLLVPVGIQFIAPFIGLFFYIKFKRADRIKKFDFLEVFLILLYTLVTLFAGVFFTLLAIDSVPWIKIILVGMAADLFASSLGSVPVFGDAVSAVLVFILVLTVIGGFTGALLAVAIGVISLLPGPSFGANTLFLVLFKLMTTALFSGGLY
jgi:hypothetical protein